MINKKFQKIIVATIIANLLLVNFVFAQSTAPAPVPAAGRGNTPQETYDALAKDTSTVLISPGEFSEINSKKLTDKCNTELSNRLYDIPFTYGLFGSGLTHIPYTGPIFDKTATWLVARWDFGDQKCTIYQKIRIGTFSGVTVDAWRSQGYRIEEESGATVRGSYYLETNDLTQQIEGTFLGVQTPLTAKALADRYQVEIDDNQASGISKVIGYALNAILSGITAFVLTLTGLVGTIFVKALDVILQSDMPETITVGWTIVRDISNMFFILALIVIALSTILRLKEYSEYGHLLAELVIMAIFVNFSMIIATTLIDFVSVIISMFAINDWKQVWVVLYRYVNFGDLNSLPNGWMAGLGQGLSKFVFAFVGLATFVALTLMLVFRIVALYILVILSPLAYALRVLPATHHYASEWWQYFVKNLIWVPVSLFVMDIGVLLAKSPQFTARDSAFNVVLIMGFFWGAVIVAEHIGAAGGKMVANIGEKAGHMWWETADKYFARGANRTGAGGYNRFRRGLSYFSAGAWKEGWQKRSAQMEHESYVVAAGKRQDLLNRVMPGRHKTDFGKKAEQQLVADEKKQILTVGNTELIAGMQQALHGKEGEKAFAYAQTLFENYDGNEALSRMGYGTDHKGFQKFIEEQFVPIMGQDRAYRLAYDLSRTAENANHWNYARAYKGQVQPDKSVKYVVNDDAAGEVNAEIAKMNPQQADRTLNRLGRGFIEVDIKIPKLDASGQQIKGADGNVVLVDERVNVGMADFGHTSRAAIDYGAAGKTFNTNTAANYMFNDSEGTLVDNKNLWLNLATKFTNMSDTQVAQTKKLISTSEYVAEKDAAGNFKKDAKGNVEYRRATADELQSRVFSVDQAVRFVKEKKLSAEDLKDFGDLRAKMMERAETLGETEVLAKLKAVQTPKKDNA